MVFLSSYFLINSGDATNVFIQYHTILTPIGCWMRVPDPLSPRDGISDYLTSQIIDCYARRVDIWFPIIPKCIRRIAFYRVSGGRHKAALIHRTPNTSHNAPTQGIWFHVMHILYSTVNSLWSINAVTINGTLVVNGSVNVLSPTGSAIRHYQNYLLIGPPATAFS